MKKNEKRVSDEEEEAPYYKISDAIQTENSSKPTKSLTEEELKELVRTSTLALLKEKVDEKGEMMMVRMNPTILETGVVWVTIRRNEYFELLKNRFGVQQKNPWRIILKTYK